MVTDSHRKLLNDFSLKLNVASWYIGISAYQEENICELPGCLRDDFEQGSSFRVQKCLQEYGLNPLLSKANILKLVLMSRGNDLAFLFFLLEGFYKTKRQDGEFSSNEKLLMIAIAKLDILPTIKELDRILPPPQYGSFEVDHKGQKKEIDLGALSLKLEHMKSHQPKEEKKYKRKKAYKLPYFQLQPRPKQNILHMTSKPPDLVVSFPFWKLKDSPDYGKDSEAPWFSQYKLNPLNRLLKDMINETMDKYLTFGDPENLKYNIQMISEISKPNVCLYHKWMAESAQLLKDEITAKARDRFMELLDVTKKETKRRTDRILEQLEHDIKECMDRNEAMMKTDLIKVQTLSEADCVLCKETRVPIPSHPKHQQEGRGLVGSCTNLAHTAIPENKFKGRQLVKNLLSPVDFQGLVPEEPCVPPPIEEPIKIKKRKTGGGITEEICDTETLNLEKHICQPGISIPNDPCYKKRNSKAFIIASGELKPKSDLNKPKPKCDFIVMKNQTKKSFFHATSANSGPYKFKYHRIFNTGKRPYDMKKHIAKSFINALGKPVEQKIKDNWTTITQPSGDTNDVDGKSDSTETSDISSSHSQQSRIDYKANIIDAVVNCVKKIWKYKESIKREEMANMKPEPEVILLKYDMEYFDPNDEGLMDRLLADGMKELQKDQRFVLATLPESHKLPALRKWIKRRFGKSYTQREILTDLEKSKRVFEIIQTMQCKPPNPDFFGLDKLSMAYSNYKYWKKINAVSEKVKDAYKLKLNNIYLNQMNICWYAMGNYKNNGGPPRNVFFAYMSTNPRDIVRHHVWNGEFRNYRMMRDCQKQKKP